MSTALAADRAYEHTKAAILDGRYRAGDLLSEGDVASALGMSRTPVREAFVRLEVERLLRLFPKKGALVSTLTAKEAAEVLEAREVIEQWAAGRIASLPIEERVDLANRLAEHLADQERAVAAGDTPASQLADVAFHMALIAAGQNGVLSDLYRSLRDRQLRLGIESVTAVSERTTEVLEEHASIIRAVKRGLAPSIQRVARAHLDGTRRSLRLLPAQ